MPEQPLIPVANPPWAGPQGLLAPPPAPARGMMQRHGSALKAMVALAVLVLAVSVAALAAWLPYSMQQQMLSRIEMAQTQEVERFVRLLSTRLEQQARPLLVLAPVVAEHMGKLAPGESLALATRGSIAALYESLHVANAQGQVLFQLKNGKEQPVRGLDEASRLAVRRGLEEAKPGVTARIDRKRADASLEIQYVVPLRNAEGKLLGVLGASVTQPAQSLLPPAAEQGERGSRWAIVDKGGQVLASSAAAARNSQAWLQPGEPRADGTAGAGSRWLGELLVTEAVVPWPQWTVVRAEDQQQLLPSLPKRQRWILAGAVLVVAVLLGVAMLFIAHPMTEIYRWALDRPGAAEGGSSGPSHDSPPLSPADMWSFEHWKRQLPEPGWGEAAAIHEAIQALAQSQNEQQAIHQQLQLQLQLLMDHAPIGLVVTQRGHIQRIGMQAARMLGYSSAELQGVSLQTLCPSPDDYASLWRRVMRDLDLYGQFDDEACLLRKDRSPVWLRIHGQSAQRLWRGWESHGEHQAQVPFVWVVEDVTTERLVRESTNWKAMHDPLTRLPNHEAFALRLHQWLAECAEAVTEKSGQASTAEDRRLAAMQHGVVLYLDLDHFSHINQQGGREAGDDVLLHVARLIEACVRPQGWVARVGGDEFAVLLPGVGQEQAMRIAQTLCMAVQDWEGVHHGEHHYLMGVSIGLLVLDAGRYTVSSAMRAADRACYAAKRKGRNRVEVLADAMD